MWVFGYRKCANCELFCSAGWFDEEGIWYCEECHVNCVMDLFSENFMYEEPPSLLGTAVRCIVGLPFRAGALVGNAAYRCTHKIVMSSARSACTMGILAVAGTAVGASVGMSVRIAIFGRRQLCNLGRAVFSRSSKSDVPIVLTEATFLSPWTVVADGREGRLSVGDPVLETVMLSEEESARRGTVRERCEDGFYIVENEARERRRVPQEDVKLDKSRVAAL